MTTTKEGREMKVMKGPRVEKQRRGEPLEEARDGRRSHGPFLGSSNCGWRPKRGFRNHKAEKRSSSVFSMTVCHIQCQRRLPRSFMSRQLDAKLPNPSQNCWVPIREGHRSQGGSASLTVDFNINQGR